jgi:hypothetical protein
VLTMTLWELEMLAELCCVFGTAAIITSIVCCFMFAADVYARKRNRQPPKE